MIQFAPKWNLIHNEHIKIHILISNVEKISLCVGVLGWNFFGVGITNCIFLKSAFVHQAVRRPGMFFDVQKRMQKSNFVTDL